MTGAFGFGTLTAKTFVTMGLPRPDEAPPGPPDAGVWYDEVMARLPATRVQGYFGGTIGSAEDEGDVQLFFYDDNHLEPVLRLVMSQESVRLIWSGLGKLLQDRLGLVNIEWKPSPGNAD